MSLEGEDTQSNIHSFDITRELAQVSILKQLLASLICPCVPSDTSAPDSPCLSAWLLPQREIFHLADRPDNSARRRGRQKSGKKLEIASEGDNGNGKGAFLGMQQKEESW